MSERIHIVVDATEKERYRRQATREGKTLSQWLREAASAKAAAGEARGLDTVEAIESFFEACDARESSREPDWAVHRRVIERSMLDGTSSLASDGGIEGG